MKMNGLFVAPVLPFDSNLKIIPSEFSSLIGQMSRIDGVGGIVVNGHAGEIATLSTSERGDTIKLARTACPKNVLVVSGVNSLSTSEAEREVKLAESSGADAALIFPPFDYFPRRNLAKNSEVVYQFFKTLSESSELPLIIFQYPKWTGISYSTETLLKLAEIDSVIAIKNAVWNVEDYVNQYDALKGTISVLAACDSPDLLGMMMIGADGALIGISNIGTDLWASFVKYCISADFNSAREMFVMKLLPIIKYVFGNMEYSQTSFVARTKEALRQLGIIGSSKVRPPELEVTAKDIAEIHTGLEKAGLLPSVHD